MIDKNGFAIFFLFQLAYMLQTNDTKVKTHSKTMHNTIHNLLESQFQGKYTPNFMTLKIFWLLIMPLYLQIKNTEVWADMDFEKQHGDFSVIYSKNLRIRS